MSVGGLMKDALTCRMALSSDIARFFAADPNILAVYLFGSQARGETHGQSDVDLAVLTVTALSPTQAFDVAQEVALLIGKNVDLLELAHASTVMQKEVVSTAVVLVDKAPHVRAAFEGLVLSQYARLNEERRPVLQQIAKDGRVGL